MEQTLDVSLHALHTVAIKKRCSGFYTSFVCVWLWFWALHYVLPLSLCESNRMNFVMYMRVMYLSLAMFVHKFQALDKQNESKNSKKLFFLFTNVLTGLAKRARERHFDSRNRGKKQHWTTKITDKHFVALAFESKENWIMDLFKWET